MGVYFPPEYKGNDETISGNARSACLKKARIVILSL